MIKNEKRWRGKRKKMKSEKKEKLEKALLFAVLFAMLAFVSVGCASGVTALGEAWNPEAPLARGGGGGGSAAPEEEWNMTFGGTGSDKANSVQQIADGGYILAGYAWSYGAGDDDFWLVKANSNGYEQWNMTFGGTKGMGQGQSSRPRTVAMSLLDSRGHTVLVPMISGW
jgi:hypothetical protein